jgi:cell fate regulator YaaT (PSP1 superfamily)
MIAARIQFVPWDKIYYYDPGTLNVEKGDRVVVKTDLGLEVGWVLGLEEVSPEAYLRSESKPTLFDNTAAPAKEAKEKAGSAAEKNIDGDGAEASDAGDKKADDKKEGPEMKPIIRVATMHDLDKLVKSEERRRALDFAIRAKEKFDLPMKIIDVHFSFDGSRITFAFIADGRVDFREMVKELTRHFGRTIRLQQIGIRDEAKCSGDFGHCGRQLCCKGFLPEFISITSEMADLQQCSHRGSERISGSCGRLMCCLQYEQIGYENMAKKLPAIGTRVNVDGKRGVIIGYNILKESVKVQFDSDNGEGNGLIAEVDLNRHKK